VHHVRNAFLIGRGTAVGANHETAAPFHFQAMLWSHKKGGNARDITN
jgi:hypothetical protein